MSASRDGAFAFRLAAASGSLSAAFTLVVDDEVNRLRITNGFYGVRVADVKKYSLPARQVYDVGKDESVYRVYCQEPEFASELTVGPGYKYVHKNTFVNLTKITKFAINVNQTAHIPLH